MRNFCLFILLPLAGFIFSCSEKQQKQNAPDEHRFKKIELASGIMDPMELDIAKNGMVYFVESSGNLKVYNPNTRLVSNVKTWQTFEGGEFGLIGLALDPNFDQNGWIYIQYAPKTPERKLLISRFTLKNDSIDPRSEKVYIEIPYENNCCHSAGSLAFDSKGNLYASTGDNSDSFFSHYALTDDRPGNRKNDALRSAGNSNDYRGKILRIHPETDGTYTIPEGNLFSDQKEGKKEIYAMGLRNPYRITVDKATDILYWGEVGPDADRDSTRGPRGYDEFNQTRKAGNFGWPLFIGDNKPYIEVDFKNEQLLKAFDPAKPINMSANNTGLKELPPAQKAWIWYAYDQSKEFSELGVGGRTAIIGPVYHYDPNLKSNIKFPEYFDKTVFIGEWMRNWLKVIHLDKDQNIERIEPFMPSTNFTKPIDMTFGPDGALYMLEYGSSWFSNTDAKLVKVEYIEGNRSPIAAIKTDKVYGSLPLLVKVSSAGSTDYDKDPLKYEWRVNAGKVISTKPTAVINFPKAGKFKVSLTVSDPSGMKDTKEVMIMPGNSIPEVKILTDNKTFYWDTLSYKVDIYDKEDINNGGLDKNNIKIGFQKLPSGMVSSQSDDVSPGIQKGQELIAHSDCKGCHLEKAKSVGPSFTDISQRYDNSSEVVNRLTEKVQKGGTGVWGNMMMSAHPQLSKEQISEMVKYILGFGKKAEPIQELSSSGNVAIKDKKSYYMLLASYKDKGAPNAEVLEGKDRMVLRPAMVKAEDFNLIFDMKKEQSLKGMHGGHAVLQNIDLTGIKTIILGASGNGQIDIYLDSLKGTLIGSGVLNTLGADDGPAVRIKETKGVHDLYFFFKNEKYRFVSMEIEWVYFSKDLINSLETKISLSSNWKFMIGDNMQWASPKFNDADWKNIPVGQKWQQSGYDHDGYAWYRTNIIIPDSLKKHLTGKKNLLLSLGKIDDVDQTFLNGKQIGTTGKFMPYLTAYDKQRQYLLKESDVLWNKENTIAIRVYSPDTMGGGMYHGPYKLSIVNADEIK